MALPKQQLPIFQTKIPSTGKTIKFRGFTVKEEKVLLLAQETEDLPTISNAIKEVLNSCVEGGIDVDKLAHFDVEYLIATIRSKSVGEVIELTLPCDVDESHRRIPYNIDISKIKVVIPEGHNKVIKLYGDVGVTMKYPSMDEMVEFDKLEGVEAVAKCIENIFTDEEVFDAKDQTTEELVDFLDSLTKVQFEKLNEEFFKTMPRYEHEIEYTCADCGHKHKKVIRGIASFFV